MDSRDLSRLKEASNIAKVIDSDFISSAESFASRLCNELHISTPDFITQSHEKGENVTLVARLIEWPFVNELKHVKIFDFICTPLILWGLAMLIVVFFEYSGAFFIIGILQGEILKEETHFFMNVREKRENMIQLLLRQLKVKFLLLNTDSNIYEYVMENLDRWTHRRKSPSAFVRFLFGSGFYATSNTLASAVYGLISADYYELFENHPKEKIFVLNTTIAILGFLPIIPRFVSLLVLIAEIKFTGMRFKKELRKSGCRFMCRSICSHFYDLLEIDPDYDLRLHLNYRDLMNIRTALLLNLNNEASVKNPHLIVMQLALAMVLERVPIKFERDRKRIRSKSLRGVSVFWFFKNFVSDSGYRANFKKKK